LRPKTEAKRKEKGERREAEERTILKIEKSNATRSEIKPSRSRREAETTEKNKEKEKTACLLITQSIWELALFWYVQIVLITILYEYGFKARFLYRRLSVEKKNNGHNAQL